MGQVFIIERIRTRLNGKLLSRETVPGITSLTPVEADAKRLLELNRGHWGIENRLHYVRDVTFDEDRSCIRTRNGPRVMATLRNVVISLLRLQSVTNIAQTLRLFSRNANRCMTAIGI